MPSSDCPAFVQFCEKYGDAVAADILERLCSLAWNGEKTDGIVTITDRHQHNAANHTYSGHVEYDGQHFDFIIDNGDWNGTVVTGWGDDCGLYHPPEPTRWMLIPVDTVRNPELAWKIWNYWRKETWFTEMIGKYSYDRHFQPGSQIENHYRDNAAKRGLQFVDLETATTKAKSFGITL